MRNSIKGIDRWLRRFVGLGLVAVYIFNLLFGTLLGLLFGSFALYFSIPFFTETTPWSVGKLLLWFDELDSEIKVGLATSLITVLGFFVAVHTAMHVWQRQTASAMRMAAADSIDRVLDEVSAVILQIQLFAEAIVREVGRVQVENLQPNAAAFLSPLSEDVLAFRSNRQRLLRLEQEVIALPDKYLMLFLPLSGAIGSLEAVAEHVESVARKVWVAAPAGGTDHPDHRRVLVETVRTSEYSDLKEACDTAHTAIAELHGGLRSSLLRPVLELNARTISQMVRLLFRGDEY